MKNLLDLQRKIKSNVNEYKDGSEDFRRGMDKVLGLLLERDLEKLTEQIEEAVKEHDLERG